MTIMKITSVTSIIFIITLELLIRVLNLDLLYLRHNLYYSSFDAEVHRVSENANLLYELTPNIEAINRGDMREQEKPGYIRNISVNPWGYRFSPWSLEKPKGVFRIVIMGGSNVYGASISDKDTFSYKLYQLLDKKYPNRFEVWNAGLTASVLSQKVELARKSLDLIQPNLLIFKLFHNVGRRAFYSANWKVPDLNYFLSKRFFEKNPELYCENIPDLFSDNTHVDFNHCELLKRVAVYRLIHILINYYNVSLEFPHNEGANCKNGKLCERIIKAYRLYADYVGERKFDKFVSENVNEKIIAFDPVRRLFCDSANNSFRGVKSFSLCTHDKPMEYWHIHPPSYVYDYYAEKTFEFLQKKNLISLNK